jgi:hypothetical protein
MGCEKHHQPAGKLTYPRPVFVQRGSTTAWRTLERDDETWKVRLIEEDFQRLISDGEDA